MQTTTLDILGKMVLMLVLCVAQALVLNHIHLFDCATPLLYVYFVVLFQCHYPSWAIMLWSFVMGLILDSFANTPGLTSASLTLLAALQPYILRLFVRRDDDDFVRPAASTLGVGKYVSYVAICVFIYSVVFFSLESFSFFNWRQWLFCIVGSSLLTIILIISLESVRR